MLLAGILPRFRVSEALCRARHTPGSFAYGNAAMSYAGPKRTICATASMSFGWAGSASITGFCASSMVEPPRCSPTGQ